MPTKIKKSDLNFPLWLHLQLDQIQISKADLMKKSGLSRTALHWWETGKMYPRTDHLIPFCQELSRLQRRRQDTVLREAIIAIKNSLKKS